MDNFQYSKILPGWFQPWSPSHQKSGKFVAEPCKIGLAMINGAISYLEKREVLATRNGDARDLDEKYCNILKNSLKQIPSKNIKVWVFNVLMFLLF
jgi:hypothetical protein